MRQIPAVFLLACTLLSTGCSVETPGLEKVVQGLKALESKANDDAKARIEQLRQGVEGLIVQAEAAGGRLEEKVVRKFIDERRKTIMEVLKAYDQVHGKARNLAQDVLVPVQALPGDLQAVLDKAPDEMKLKLIELFILADVKHPANPFVKLMGNERLVVSKGLLVGMHSGSSYHLSFLAKNPPSLRLVLPGQKPIRPSYAEGAIVIFKVPAGLLASKFKELDSDSILNNRMGFRLVELGGKGKEVERYRGELILLPMFHTGYRLTATDRRGHQRAVTVDRGAGILELLAAKGESMRQQGGKPKDIAAKHGELYRLATTHLPYGYSEVVLLPDDEVWSLEVKVGGRRVEVLNQQRLDAVGVRVKTTTVKDRSGRECKKLMIYVDPVNP